MRLCVVDPFLRINNFELQLDNLHFFLLVLATVLLAAGGYAINDYFDTFTDQLNKPDRLLVDRKISRKSAMFTHLVMIILGVGLGIFLSFYIKVPGLSVLFILPAGLLWFYSASYKQQFLIGNLLVSFMTAGVPMLVIFYELPLLNRTYGDIMIRNHTNFNYIFFWVAGFSFFAFVTTLLREIIKDSEDFEGDSAYGMNTIPIALGTKTARIIMLSLISICIGMLVWILFGFIMFSQDFTDYLSGMYFLFLLIIPFMILFFIIIRAGSKRDYFIASQITKGIMIAGILYSIVVRYIILNKLN